MDTLSNQQVAGHNLEEEPDNEAALDSTLAGAHIQPFLQEARTSLPEA